MAAPHQLTVVESADDDGILGSGEFRQISAFVVEIALVEIGPLAEDGNSQLRQVVESGGQVFTGQSFENDVAHVPSPSTWRIHSARL